MSHFISDHTDDDIRCCGGPMGSKRRQERRSRVFFQVFARFLYVNAFPDSQICAYAPGKRAGRYAGRSPRFSLSYISYNSGIFSIMSNDHLVAVPILHMSGPSQAHRDCWHWQAIGPPPSLRRILRTGTVRAGSPRGDAPHGASTSPSRLCAILDSLR